MSQPCTIDACKRTSRALCHCCQKNLCIIHLNEHNDSLNSQLHPLADEINALGERLKTLNIQNIVGDCRQQLEQWRQDCHKKIDLFFEQKCQELDHLVTKKLDKPRENITHIRSKVAELIRDQEATRQDIDTLTSTIRELKKEMNTIEQAHFQIYTHPFRIDDTIVQIKETYAQEFVPSTLSSVHKTIVHPEGSSRALAANDQFLLIHQKPNLWFLDAELKIVKQVLWPYDLIRDICWSKILDRFVVILRDNIFLVNENTMSIDRVSTIEKQNWGSCTCFNTQLFLSTNVWGSSIMEISMLPAITIIKEWKSPTTCTKDESIDDIVYNNGSLALVIRNKVEKSIRMELRSCQKLDRLWSLLLNVAYDNDAFRCCSLDCNGWLVAGFSAGRLLHITKDGKMKQTIAYKAIPYRITLFDSSTLAISTESGINFHKI